MVPASSAPLESVAASLVSVGQVDERDMRAVLGRLLFVAGEVHFLKPFRMPLYARVPRMLLAILVFMRMPRAPCLSPHTQLKRAPPVVMLLELFRVDVKVEGSRLVLGGWRIPPRGPRKPRGLTWSLDRMTFLGIAPRLVSPNALWLCSVSPCSSTQASSR